MVHALPMARSIEQNPRLVSGQYLKTRKVGPRLQVVLSILSLGTSSRNVSIAKPYATPWQVWHCPGLHDAEQGCEPSFHRAYPAHSLRSIWQRAHGSLEFSALGYVRLHSISVIASELRTLVHPTQVPCLSDYRRGRALPQVLLVR